MSTVTDRLRDKIARLRELKQRAVEEAQGYQAQIDALKALQDGLTPEVETHLRTLAKNGVITVED